MRLREAATSDPRIPVSRSGDAVVPWLGVCRLQAGDTASTATLILDSAAQRTLPISGPGLQIKAGKQTMPKSGGNKDTEAGAGGQRKRRAEEDTGSSSSSSGVAVKTEQGQRKRRAGGGAGQELPGRVMVMAAADVVLIVQGCC